MSERLDDLDPLDPEDHARQLEAVLELAGTNGPVVDLGAGSGRLAAPLAKAGVAVLAVDLDPEVLRSGDWSKLSGVSTLVEDFLDDRASWPARGPFQTCLCLGNTLALLTKHREVERLFQRVAASLERGGRLLIDDFPVWGWDAVQSGDWPAGLSDDGEAQMVWRPGEPVFAFRTGTAVDPGSDQIGPEDRPLRLWSLSELDYLAGASGLTPPILHLDHHLIEFGRR